MDNLTGNPNTTKHKNVNLFDNSYDVLYERF